MARFLRVAAAQMGPIQRSDSRESAVKRLIAMLREAHASQCKLVVFSELTLTTFFPRYYMEDQKAIDSYFETEMPTRGARARRRFLMKRSVWAWDSTLATPNSRVASDSIHRY
jgi:predicted amidohydrolase